MDYELFLLRVLLTVLLLQFIGGVIFLSLEEIKKYKWR